jgi:hypothetical protein
MSALLRGRPQTRAYLDGLPALDLYEWQRLRLLRAGAHFACSWPGGRIEVLVDPEEIVLLAGEVVEHVKLTRTTSGIAPCTWFLCPGCGRRCAVLHWQGRAGCRRCARLAYRSQSESPSDRALRRARAIRRSLGGSGDLSESLPPRPKGMRRRTYIRRLEQLVAAEAQVWQGVARRAEALSLIRRLDGERTERGGGA